MQGCEGGEGLGDEYVEGDEGRGGLGHALEPIEFFPGPPGLHLLSAGPLLP